MRKDIRFGLTIGVCLLAVTVAWLLIGRGDHKIASDVSLVSSNDSSSGAVPTTNPSPLADARGIDNTDTSPRADSSAATQPAMDAAAPSSTARDWNELLNSTPTAPSSEASASPTTQPILAADLILAPAKQPAVASVASAARTHKVLAGESFFTIAAAEYGDSSYFSRIEDANPNVNPNRLRIGTVLTIPDLKSPVVARSSPDRSDASKAAALDTTRSYRVRPSDTLMAIARKLYGDGQQWGKIYDANRDAIGPNPARLKVDMVLRLPQPPSVALAN